MKLFFGVFVGLLCGSVAQPACNAPIYCDDSILSVVQPMHFWNDSKTFVDLPLLYEPEEVVKAFKELGGSPSREQVWKWIENYFGKVGSDVLSWIPNDWSSEPPNLLKIKEQNYRNWALDINLIWKELGKQIDPIVRQQKLRHSLIPPPNPWIAPGGRFREFYYWDSFWIIKGLLHCGMFNTSKMMLENLVWIVNEVGFVPNGARVYYEKRSQPPLLTLMVDEYLQITGDSGFVKTVLPTLDKEYDFWMKNSSVVLYNGITLNRYIADSSVPRPEGYNEDIEIAKMVPQQKRAELFTNIATAAESGWDFSTRWLNNSDGAPVGLAGIITSKVIPVDLNSILFVVETKLSEMHSNFGQISKAEEYIESSKRRAKAINEILWNPSCQIWTDCILTSDGKQCEQRNCSFYPSNMMPLWSGSFKGFVDPSIVVKNLLGSKVLSFPGGVPTSTVLSGLQWDWPLAWAPCEWFVVQSLEFTGFSTQAKTIAQTWIKSNLDAWINFGGHMYEKYDCREDGMPGDSGEYDVQLGFGWTNGVVLDFLMKYYTN